MVSSGAGGLGIGCVYAVLVIPVSKSALRAPRARFPWIREEEEEEAEEGGGVPERRAPSSLSLYGCVRVGALIKFRSMMRARLTRDDGTKSHLRGQNPISRFCGRTGRGPFRRSEEGRQPVGTWDGLSLTLSLSKNRHNTDGKIDLHFVPDQERVCQEDVRSHRHTI